MSRPLLFITGFGPFEDIRENPSGLLVSNLLQAPPAQWQVAGGVLPVSFERGPRRFAELLRGLGERCPDLILALGVHRQPGFRIELQARRRLTETERPDVDGRCAAEGSGGRDPSEGVLRVRDSAPLEAFARERPGWRISHDAGGYVCERILRSALEWGTPRGARAVFVHVPQLRFTPLREQRVELLSLADALR